MAAMGGRDDLRFSTFVPLVEDLLEGPGARSTPSTVPSSEPAPTPSGGGTGPSSRLPSGFKLRSRLVDLGTVPEIRANLQTILVMETELGRTERIQKVLSLLERLDTVEREAVARYGEETFDTMDLTLSIRVPIILPDDHPTPSLTRSSVGEPEAEAEAEFDCPICFDSVPADQGYALLSCTHRYCQGCFVGYFQNKIRDGEVSKKDLKCPDPSCPAVPEDYELEAVLSPEDYTKYLDFLAMQGVREEQSIVWCPNTECREAIMAEAASDRVDCPACKTAFCRKCQLFPWHDKQTCEEAKAARDVDRSLVIWMEEKGSKVKPCPSCKEGIEKNDGCNHMTCARCKHQWCWLCVGNYEYGHFNSGPCNGLQFAKGDTLEEALALRRPSSSPAAPVAAPTTARVTVAPVRPSHLAHLDRNIPDAEVRAYQALMARQASSSSSSPSSSSSGPTVRPLIRPVPASLEAPWYVRLRNKFRN